MTHSEMLQDDLRDYELIFENLYDGVLLVDKNGYIKKITKAYCDFLRLSPDEAIGQHIADVIENTRMPICLSTGESEIGELQRINGQQAIVERIPVLDDGQVVCGVGKVMFRNVKDFNVLAKRLNIAEKKLNFYQKELKRIQGAKYNFGSIIYKSEAMEQSVTLAKKVANSHSSVLILGDSGTGKELFAHAIHEESSRANEPFVRVNCASIPADLVESELFGYEDGTFTGGKKGGKAGKVEIAAGGTLFLDEIGDMPIDIQVKILRFLQEKEIQRVGSALTTPVDVRVIAATNKDLNELVKENKFREDLYYRLNVFTIQIPSLRERKDDIIPLAAAIAKKLGKEFGTSISGFSAEATELFHHYSWPGNVRELHNVIERAVNVMENTTIQLEDLPLYLREWSNHASAPPKECHSLQAEVEQFEKKLITNALHLNNGNRNQTAKQLGIHRATLYRKMEQYNI